MMVPEDRDKHRGIIPLEEAALSIDTRIPNLRAVHSVTLVPDQTYKVPYRLEDMNDTMLPMFEGAGTSRNRFVFGIQWKVSGRRTASNVYPMVDRAKGRYGIAKVLRKEEQKNHQTVGSMLREGHLLARLLTDDVLHDRLVDLWGVGVAASSETGGRRITTVLFEEYLYEEIGWYNAGQLEQGRLGNLRFDDRLAFCRELCLIDSRLYELGVLHQDLSAYNYYFHPEDRRLKLGDFSSATGVSERGTVNRYFSPWEADSYSGEILDVRTETYNLIVNLAYILSGGKFPHDVTHRPFDRIRYAPTLAEDETCAHHDVLAQFLDANADMINTQARELVGMVEKGLAVDPNNRFQTPHEILPILDSLV